jgi:hypothetical protein
MEILLDMLLGHKNDAPTTKERLDQAEKEHKTKDIMLRHFKVTFYKNGTSQLEFQDTRTLDLFNRVCCLLQEWLPKDNDRTFYDYVSGNDSGESTDYIRYYDGLLRDRIDTLDLFALPELRR